MSRPHHNRVLVTGGSGFLGQALVRAIAEQRVSLANRVELIAYDLVGTPGVSNMRGVPSMPCTPSMPVIHGDILDRRALDAALTNVDAVIHCATLVDWSDLDTERLERVNVDGTQNLLEACVANEVRCFIHTSTMDVVCGDGHVREADELRPYPNRFLDAYGRSKAEAERRVRRFSHALATVTLRLCAMYGEADPFKVPSFLQEARAGRLLFRIGDGSARMQPLYVGNAAVATLLALDRLLSGHDATRGQTFFVADHPPANFFEWMGPILAGLGHPIPTRRLPANLALAVGACAEWLARHTGGRPAITRSSVNALCHDITVDDSRARSVLGYAPPYSYEEGVARTVAWFKPA